MTWVKLAIKVFKTYRKTIKLVALLTVFALFIYYIRNNSEQFIKLKYISLGEGLLIVLGQLLVLLSNALMLIHIASISGKRLEIIDSMKITAYSAIVNFFGFLQGGVGVRAIYLKNKLKIPFKRFLYFTAIQYIILFFISLVAILCGLLLIGSKVIIAISVIGAAIAFLFIANNILKRGKNTRLMSPLVQSGITGFIIISLIQVFGSSIAYTTELSVVGANFSLGALLIFVGISQFSIVLAITPGAVGIREGLLLVVAQYMSLSVDTIVLSSVLDRTLFFITFALVTPLATLAKREATFSQYIQE